MTAPDDFRVNRSEPPAYVSPGKKQQEEIRRIAKALVEATGDPVDETGWIDMLSGQSGKIDLRGISPGQAKELLQAQAFKESDLQAMPTGLQELHRVLGLASSGATTEQDEQLLELTGVLISHARRELLDGGATEIPESILKLEQQARKISRVVKSSQKGQAGGDEFRQL